MSKNMLAAHAWLTKLKKFTNIIATKKRVVALLVVIVSIILTTPNVGITANKSLQKISAKQQKAPKLADAPAVPVKIENAAPLEIDARGAIVIDTKSSSVLFEQDPDRELLPASTTKIMTSLVALEGYQLSDVVTIDREEHTIGHTMNLVRGEKISVENLLYGVLVSSGNDAALALAISYPHGGYIGFISDMNKKAAELNLNKTTYKNVSGLETRGHTTTARNLAILAKEALKNQTFRKMVSTQNIKIESVDGAHVHNLESTNYLLGRVEGVTGVKTGWTQNALECLVTSVERNGHEVIVVILGSGDRFGNTQKLIDWVYQNHYWEIPNPPDKTDTT